MTYVYRGYAVSVVPEIPCLPQRVGALWGGTPRTSLNSHPYFTIYPKRLQLKKLASKTMYIHWGLKSKSHRSTESFNTCAMSYCTYIAAIGPFVTSDNTQICLQLINASIKKVINELNLSRDSTNHFRASRHIHSDTLLP